MKNVGIVAVKDYLLNVASDAELMQFEQLIKQRRDVLCARTLASAVPHKRKYIVLRHRPAGDKTSES